MAWSIEGDHAPSAAYTHDGDYGKVTVQSKLAAQGKNGEIEGVVLLESGFCYPSCCLPHMLLLNDPYVQPATRRESSRKSLPRPQVLPLRLHSSSRHSSA